jgi:hypothetical protein
MNPQTTLLHEQLEAHKKNMEKVLGKIEKAPPIFSISFPISIILKEHALISITLAQLAEIESQRLEQKTNQLIKLTWALLAVTVALLVFGFVQTAIMLKQDANAHTQQIQAGQHQ